MLIDSNIRAYEEATTKKKKAQIVTGIVDAIHENHPNGRFVKKVSFFTRAEHNAYDCILANCRVWMWLTMSKFKMAYIEPAEGSLVSNKQESSKGKGSTGIARCLEKCSLKSQSSKGKKDKRSICFELSTPIIAGVSSPPSATIGFRFFRGVINSFNKFKFRYRAYFAYLHGK